MINNLFLTIDFENKRYDLARQLGIKKKIETKEHILWEAYNNINQFLEKSLVNGKITFFCTGNLTKSCPDLIKKISSDGHEIASHYYNHDLIYRESLKDFEYNIQKSIDVIQSATNREVFGFRAPFFSINNENLGHYKILSKYFKYDSSLNLDNYKDVLRFTSKLNNEKFKLFPVISSKVSFFLPKIKLGGTYLKLLKVDFMLKLIKKSQANNIVPVIYLHPYEFINDKQLDLNWEELRELGAIKQIYWYLNQKKWHNNKNKTVVEKLDNIFQFNINGNTMKELYDANFH